MLVLLLVVVNLIYFIGSFFVFREFIRRLRVDEAQKANICTGLIIAAIIMVANCLVIVMTVGEYMVEEEPSYKNILIMGDDYYGKDDVLQVLNAEYQEFQGNFYHRIYHYISTINDKKYNVHVSSEVQYFDQAFEVMREVNEVSLILYCCDISKAVDSDAKILQKLLQDYGEPLMHRLVIMGINAHLTTESYYTTIRKLGLDRNLVRYINVEGYSAPKYVGEVNWVSRLHSSIEYAAENRPPMSLEVTFD